MDTNALSALYGLDGRGAIVTGAGAGIGRQIAQLLATAGAKVIAADYNLEGAEVTAKTIREAGGKAYAVQVDISNESSVTAMVARATELAGGVDVLVNNAAIYSFTPFLEVSVEKWERTHSVNTLGTFLCTRETIKQMRKAAKGGAIVNISSLSSMDPIISHMPDYCSSKAGVNMLTKVTAMEFAADGIRVNAVLPGGIATDSAKSAAAGKDLFGPITQPGRKPFGQGEPADIAKAALFLASPASRYITGQLLVVDGGFQVS